MDITPYVSLLRTELANAAELGGPEARRLAERLTAPVESPLDGDDAAVSRINLRLPENLKGRVEQAAGREGLSVNAWLVRAVAAAVQSPAGPQPATARAPR